MTREYAIPKIMEKFNISLNLASELYWHYRKSDKLDDLEILLRDLDLDEYRKSKKKATQ